jgi:hypothetical protein
MLVLGIVPGLARGLMLVPLMTDRSSLVKMELRMGTISPSNPDMHVKLEEWVVCRWSHLGPGPSVLVVLSEDEALVLILVLGDG